MYGSSTSFVAEQNNGCCLGLHFGSHLYTLLTNINLDRLGAAIGSSVHSRPNEGMKDSTMFIFLTEDRDSCSGVLRLATLEMFKWLPKESFILTRTLPLDS